MRPAEPARKWSADSAAGVTPAIARRLVEVGRADQRQALEHFGRQAGHSAEIETPAESRSVGRGRARELRAAGAQDKARRSNRRSLSSIASSSAKARPGSVRDLAARQPLAMSSAAGVARQADGGTAELPVQVASARGDAVEPLAYPPCLARIEAAPRRAPSARAATPHCRRGGAGDIRRARSASDRARSRPAASGRRSSRRYSFARGRN